MPKEKDFKSKWLERLDLPDDWRPALEERLDALPFSRKEKVMPLFEALFDELPKRLGKSAQNNNNRDAADAVGRWCRAILHGESAYLKYSRDFADFLLRSIRKGSLLSNETALALIQLFRSEKTNSLRCGFNQLVPKNSGTIVEGEEIAANGTYEDFLTDRGKGKYHEYEEKLRQSATFQEDWTLVKQTFPKYIDRPILRRSLLSERNWQKGQGVSFESEKDRFQAVFDLFCWKYFLYGMRGDEPLLQKPSVNLTAHGTQIFIPGYLSLDSKRDLDFKKVNQLHRARGTKRQGPALSESRENFAKKSKEAKRHAKEGRQNGLKGDYLYDFIAQKMGLPHIDPRQIRRWLPE